MQSDTNPIHVAQLTGHKNLKSLDWYSKASDAQQKHMSHLISNTSVALSNVTNTAAVSSQGNKNVVSSHHNVLPGMQITGNSVVNVYFNQVSSQANHSVSYTNSPPRKRHRSFFLDSSDEEQ